MLYENALAAETIRESRWIEKQSTAANYNRRQGTRSEGVWEEWKPYPKKKIYIYIYIRRRSRYGKIKIKKRDTEWDSRVCCMDNMEKY
jgi:hypothetical protein